MLILFQVPLDSFACEFFQGSLTTRCKCDFYRLVRKQLLESYKCSHFNPAIDMILIPIAKVTEARMVISSGLNKPHAQRSQQVLNEIDIGTPFVSAIPTVATRKYLQP